MLQVSPGRALVLCFLESDTTLPHVHNKHQVQTREYQRAHTGGRRLLLPKANIAKTLTARATCVVACLNIATFDNAPSSTILTRMASNLETPNFPTLGTEASTTNAPISACHAGDRALQLPDQRPDAPSTTSSRNPPRLLPSIMKGERTAMVSVLRPLDFVYLLPAFSSSSSSSSQHLPKPSNTTQASQVANSLISHLLTL